MGLLHVLISIITVFLFWKMKSMMLMLFSAIVLVIIFWSFGVMHNFATEMAKKRSTYTGGFNDFTTREVNSVPNWITSINMISCVVGVILFIISIYQMFIR